MITQGPNIGSRLGLVLLLIALMAPPIFAADSSVAIAIHGGAGTIKRSELTPEQDRAYRSILDKAVELGHQRLLAGVDGIDVIVEVIQLLEASPLFNAGHGAVMTWTAEHELDASIMNGATLEAGAVAGVKRLKSPIAAARAVMLASPHVLLSGTGADEFGLQQGLEQVDNAWFTTERRQRDLERYKARQDAGLSPEATAKFGTVGVVVLDAQGHLAAGTSTGGMTGKRWGRIGDSPIIGAGTYANDRRCAVSATGHGEFFIRWHVASDICARVAYQGVPIEQAATDVIMGELLPAGGEGGVIALDPKGNVAMVFNSEGMYRASIDRAGQKVVAIYDSQSERDSSEGEK